MHFLPRRTAFISIVAFFLFTGICFAQTGRILGARGFQIDDGSHRSLTLNIAAPLSASYILHFPTAPPSNGINFLISDANGNLSWGFNTLPALPPGNIWYGNSLSVATPLAPTVAGAILSLDNSLFPKWTTVLPSSTTVSAAQLTSGTLPPGTTIVAGSGASIRPGGGTIDANTLSGNGTGKYSGKIIIPSGINHLDISYPPISAFSSVTVTVLDPQAMTFGFVDAKVSQITSGVGFRVIFSADYPNSGTGELNYIVVNP